jgi:hypothetical protein
MLTNIVAEAEPEVYVDKACFGMASLDAAQKQKIRNQGLILLFALPLR